MLNFNAMREIYRRTRVIRRPTYGIVSGYHTLPYVCLGEAHEPGCATTRVSGTIHVSPRFILRPEHLEPRYRDLFDDENLDGELAGRVFGYLGFRERPVECTSDHLDVKHLEAPVERVLHDVLDDIERREDITMGVIMTPDTRYYPVSIERFIATVLEDEFSV